MNYDISSILLLILPDFIFSECLIFHWEIFWGFLGYKKRQELCSCLLKIYWNKSTIVSQTVFAFSLIFASEIAFSASSIRFWARL